MKKKSILSIAISMFALSTLYAQDAPVEATPEKSTGKLTVSGYTDVYYMYNMNNPSFAKPQFDPNTGTFTGNVNPGRVFDVAHNTFSLGLIQTKFAYTTDKSEVVLDLTYGPNAALGNFGNAANVGDLFIKQAYMAYNFTDKLKVTVGQFGTHVGYELIDAPLNYNYSLSYLFGNGPFYHTGAKASYMLSDKIGLMAGIVNGWDAMYDFNSKKSAIAQLYIAPKDGWDVYINYVGGDEKKGFSFPTIAAAPDSVKTSSHIFDLTTAYQVSDKFKVGLNAAYGMGNKLKIDPTSADGLGKASWYGAALYLNYSISDVFGLGLRAEHFNDKDGVRYVGNQLFGSFVSSGVVGVAVSGLTLTGDVKLKDGHFVLKPEFRLDIANPIFADGATDADKEYKGFVKNPGSDNPKATSMMPTIGMAAIYAF
jgi:hypothetical protein